MEFKLSNMLFSYSLKDHDSEKRRYTLYGRKYRDRLIMELSMSDKQSKSGFFFVSADCLENKEAGPKFYSLHKKWVTKIFIKFLELVLD